MSTLRYSAILLSNPTTEGVKGGGKVSSISFILRREGGPVVKKTSSAYMKVQTVMDLILFTESQNLSL